jgi:xanthine dehydrogenase accessory factor
LVDTDLTHGGRVLLLDTLTYPDDIATRLSAGESFLIDSPEGRRFVQALVPAVHVILVGAGHIAQVLADIADRVSFQVTIVDPRTAFSSEQRFAGFSLVQEWPEAALPALGMDARTAVVTLAHEGRLDDETLTAALRSPCFYVGALGSRRTHEKRVERLRKAGLTDAEIGRIDAPVGISIGAKGPAEIAVSILAAIIRARHGA